MKQKEVSLYIKILLIIVGLLFFMLSYFETYYIKLFYQVFSMVLFLFFIVMVYFEMIPKTKKIKMEHKEDDSMFKKNIISINLEETPDEKKIIKYLNKNKKSASQSDIQKKVFSGNKSKTTRVISSLEKKGFVKKVKKGRFNQIELC